MNQQFILKTKLMENYDRTMELVETAQNSAGKSDEQFAKYTDTLEYKVKQLKGSWEELRQSFLKSDFLKNAVDWINKLVDKLTNLNLKDFALLGTLGLTVGKSSLQKMVQTYQDSFNKIGKATSKLKERMYGKGQEVNKKSQEQKNAEEAAKVYDESITKAGQSLKDDATEGGKNLKESVVEAGDNIESSLERGGEKLVEKAKEAATIVDGNNSGDTDVEVSIKDEEGKQQNQSDVVENLKEATEQQKQAAETQRQAAIEQNKAATEQNYASDDQSNAANKQEQAANKQEQAAATEAIGAGVPVVGDNGGVPVAGNNRGTLRGTGTKGKWKTGGKQILSSGGKAFVSGTTQAIGPAVITAFTTALSGGDFKDVVKNTLITAASVILPEVLAAIAPTIVGLFTGPAGWIVLAAAAITTTIYAVTKNWKNKISEVEQAEIDRLKNVEQANEELSKKQQNAIDDNKKLNSDQNKLQEDIDVYNRFHGNAFLTDENQKKLEAAIEDLNSNFSDVVTSYDKATQTLEINTNSVDLLTQEYDQQRKENMTTIASAGNQIAKNINFQADKTQEILNNYKKLGDFSARKTSVGKSEFGLQIKASKNAIIDFFTGQPVENNLDRMADAAGTWNNFIDEMTSKGEGLTDELQNEILQSYSDAIGESITSFDELSTSLQKSQDNVDIFSKSIRNLNGLLPQDKINEEFQKTAQQYLQAASTDEFEITGQLAEAVTTGMEAFEGYGEEVEKSTAQAIKDSYGVDQFHGGTVGSWAAEIGANIGANISGAILPNIASGFSENGSFGQRAADAAGLYEATSDKIWDEIKDNDLFKNISAYDIQAKKGDWGELKAFDDMTEEVRSALEAAGVTKDIWDSFDLKNNGSIVELLDLAQRIGEKTLDTKEELQKITDLVTDERVSGIYSEWQDLQVEAPNLTQEEYQKQLDNILQKLKNSGVEGIEDLVTYMQNYENEIESSTTQRNEIADNTLREVFSDPSIFNDWAMGVKEAVVSQLQSMNLSDAEMTKVADIWQEILNNYSGQIRSNVANVLSQIDLTEGFSSLFANRDQFVQQLEEAGLSANDAAKTYADYISKGTNAIVSVLTNTAALKTSFEEFTTGIKSAIDSNKDVMDAFSKWQSGEGTYDDIVTLMQTGIDNFDINSKTGEIKFDAKKIVGSLAETADASFQSQIEQYAKTPQFLSVLQKGNKNKYQRLLDEYAKGNYNNYSEFAQAFGFQIQDSGVDQGVLKSITEAGVKTVQDYVDTMKETYDQMPEYVKASAIAEYQAIKDFYGNVEDKEEELEDAKRKKAKADRDYQKALRDEKKAHDDLADAIEAEADAYKALQESYYGTEFYDSNLDDLYNYEQRLTSINKKLEKFSSLLEDTSDISSATKAWNGYADTIHEQLATTEAKTQLNQNLADEGKNFLMQKYSQYFSIDDYGKLMPDISLLEDSKIPDAEKDFIGEMIQKVNEYTDAVADGEKEAYDIRKEYQDKLKDLYKNYVSLEDNIADVLKKQAEEEVDVQKDKYSQLKEADDDYLDALQDAIDRQRKLRDAENQYEDLAQKQKKLSLMQRDTSGANRKEALSLEEEIKDDQQNLLDQEVDNIIDNMKSLQETQQELRDTEIELKEAVIEETNWSKEANAILKTFTTAEDYVGWMAANDVDFQDMSVDKQAVQMDEWAEQGNQIVNYLATQSENIQTATQTTANEILNIINTTSEGATGSIERDSEKVQTEIAEAQKEAEQAYEDAKEAVIDAKDAVADAKDNVADAKNNVKEADQAVITATNNLETAKIGFEDFGGTIDEFVQKRMEQWNQAVSNLIDLPNTGNNVNYYQKGQIKANQTQAETRRIADAEKTKHAINPNENKKHTTAVQLSKNLTEEKVGKKAILQFSSDSTLRPIDEDTAKRMQQQGVDQGINAHSKTSDFLLKDENGKYYITSKKRTAEIWGTQGLDRYRFVNTGGGSLKHKQWVKYATGGIVDYTGPAWVDGTKTKPEAFLSATDTENIRQMMDIMNILLSNFSTPSKSTYESSSNVVSPNIEVTVNVDSISSDYDVDQATERVKQNILDAYNKTGNSVILRK